MKKIVTICLTLFLTVGTIANAAVIWGVTGPSGVTSGGGELFNLDTSTNTIKKIADYSSTDSYGDIAVTPSGRLYVVGNVGAHTWATGIGELDPESGNLEWSNTTGMNFNALTAESDTSLLAVQGGGGGNADLYRLHLDTNGYYTGKTYLGVIDATASGGDITQKPDGSYIAATANGTDIYGFQATTPFASSKTCDIVGLDWVGALGYDYAAGVLYCAKFSSKQIYTLDLSNGSLTPITVTGDTLTGYGIYGFASQVPEPCTMAMFCLGSLILVRKRK